MSKPERFFDCIAFQLEKFPKPDMLAAKENGIWRKYSTKEISETVDSTWPVAYLPSVFPGMILRLKDRTKLPSFQITGRNG